MAKKKTAPRIARTPKYNFSDIKVLVIGDVMLDYYMFGEVNRISPEAPVPVVEVYKKEGRPGGAANVALNIHKLGATPILLSVIGSDDTGRSLETILQNFDISTDHVLVETGRITTLKTRLFDDDKQVVRFDEEDISDIAHDTEAQLLARMETIVKRDRPDLILLQDYDKGVLTKKVIKSVLLTATKNAIPVTVDPKEKHFFEYQSVDLLKPNLKEVSEALGHKVNARSLENLKRAAEELRRKTRFKNLMITLGARGIFCCTREGEMFVVPPKVVKAADVSGAGDTVISVASLCFHQKLPMKQIAALCNKAAAQVCRQIGVVPVSLKDLGTEKSA